MVDGIIAQYLDCGAGFKFKGLGLPVLQIHLQNVRQEEQRVALQSRREVRGQRSGKVSDETVSIVKCSRG